MDLFLLIYVHDQVVILPKHKSVKITTWPCTISKNKFKYLLIFFLVFLWTQPPVLLPAASFHLCLIFMDSTTSGCSSSDAPLIYFSFGFLSPLLDFYLSSSIFVSLSLIYVSFDRYLQSPLSPFPLWYLTNLLEPIFLIQRNNFMCIPHVVDVCIKKVAMEYIFFISFLLSLICNIFKFSY